MILYFSGTGNSRYAAKIIQEAANDELISMNELIKAKDNTTLKSDKPFVFLCPTYSFNIPEKEKRNIIYNLKF